MKKTISIRMVHVLAVILFAGATLVDSEQCPRADRIFPCVCHGDTDNIKDVICKNMTTVDYLRHRFGDNQFKQPIPKLVITNLKAPILTPHALADIKAIDLEILDGNIPLIDTDAFRGQVPTLVSLRLDRNGLLDVPADALDFLRDQLKTLSMTGNVFKELRHTPLILLFKVQELTLSENQISEIATKSLPPYVQSLWISRNNLTTFNGALRNTIKLKYLDASYNKLTSIKGEFVGVSDLKWLILNHNNISDISDSFSDVPSLKKLSLAVNRIQEIGDALADLRLLRRLNLANNLIRNLNRGVFENMKGLFDLNLSKNLLTAYQICPTLKPLGSIKRLKISNSNMDTIPSDCFDDVYPQFLNLSGNRLSALELKNVTYLIILDISFNNFSSMDNLKLPFRGTTTLILEDNPWQCSRNTTAVLTLRLKGGYSFEDGFPGCLPISEKHQTCLKYADGFP